MTVQHSEIYNKISEFYFNSGIDNRKKITGIYKNLKLFYKTLILEEQRHFSTLLAGISFINDKFNLEDNLKDKLQNLSKLIRIVSKNPKISVSTDEVNFAFKYSILIISHISDSKPDELIESLLNSLPELSLRHNYRPEKEVMNLSGAKVKYNPFYRKKIDAQYIELICYHDETEDFNLKIGYPYLQMANMIYEGMNFNLFSAEVIRQEPLTLSIRYNGLFVFEPDYLIDATDLAESYGIAEGYRIFFLKRYFSIAVGLPLVMGNLINTLFDEVLLNPEIEYEKAKDTAFKQKPLPLFALLAKAAIKPKQISAELESYHHKIRHIVKNDLAEIFEGAVFSVESSFISPDYGIQGRLDLLAEYPDEPLRKDIVELKSGSCPNIAYSMTTTDNRKIPIGVWQNHLAQVIAYNLLLESAFTGRKGNSSILYIKSDDKPLRDVANFPNVVQNMILHRNSIILLENAIISCSFKFFETCKSINLSGLPSYISEKVNSFVNVYEILSETEKSYLHEFSAFVLRESYASKTGASLDNGNMGYSALWNESMDDKTDNHSILMGLSLDMRLSDFDNFHLVFDLNNADVFTSFRKGDIAVIFSYTEETTNAKISNQLLKCTIKSIDSERVVVSLRNKLISYELFNSHLLWRLEPDNIDSLDKHSYSSVFKFLKCKTQKKNLVFGIEEPDFLNELEYFDDYLNENQRQIVVRAINAKDYFLIQGPPGTGKTNVVLKHIVKAITNLTEQNILICAYTNRAVDEIFYALSTINPEIEYIRIGSKEASDDSERHLPNVVDKYGMNEAYKRLNRARVVISTVASIMTNEELFDIKTFDTLIVDESSQILEPHLLGIISKVNRFILIGDEKQLPPVVIQNETGRICHSEELNKIGLYNFSESLFERLIRVCKNNNWVNAFGQLEYQARMHSDIQEFPNLYFYENALKISFHEQDTEITKFHKNSSNPIERILAEGRMIFIDCPQQRGKVNSFEAETAINIINFLYHDYEQNQNLVGVISPFRIQCFEIFKRLTDLQKPYITVDTVERFQGSQREYIILSMAAGSKSLLDRAVSNDITGMIDRKLNVAITRAKSHFILLGNSDTLNESLHYRNLIDFIGNNNLVFKYSDLTGK